MTIDDVMIFKDDHGNWFVIERNVCDLYAKTSHEVLQKDWDDLMWADVTAFLLKSRREYRLERLPERMLSCMVQAGIASDQRREVMRYFCSLMLEKYCS